MDINTLTAIKIKEMRNTMGLTSEFVAQQLGIAPSNYSDLENGKRAISIEKLDKLSKIFEVPFNSLIPSSDGQATININNGEHGIASQQNFYNDKEIISALQQALELINQSVNKIKE